MLIQLFDFLKRINMNRAYQSPDPWNRENRIGDIDSAVELVSDQRYGICLDVGTGIGHYAERMAKICDKVIAIDISPEAIKKAKKISNVEYQVANIRTYIAPAQFDLIVLGDVLYYLGDVRFPKEFDKLIAHIYGLLKPMGRILISSRLGFTQDSHITHFLEQGLKIEKEKIFNDGKRNWKQVVLTN